MKFAVGYQMFPDAYFMEKIIQRGASISEVYFSWGDFPNGRNSQCMQAGMTPEQAQEKQFADLKMLNNAGISLDLLFNATCYGKDSLSKGFFQKVGDTVDILGENFCLKTVTTTSPVIAGFIKSNFPVLDVRASVNMSIGTIEGMEYVAEYFDSFYVKRELNRNLQTLKELKNWCDNNGKKMYGLVNSGCLNHCSAHTFHDNLVAHESDISKMDNGYAFEGVCRKYLKDPNRIGALLDNTNFIRPEDVHLYEGIFSAMKLATRVNADPVKVLRAYIENRAHIGSVLDLLEPNHSAVIYPTILENSRIESVVTEQSLKYINIEKALIKLEDAYADK